MIMLFAIASFLGFMVNKFYTFYYRKHHLVCFLPKLIVCKPISFTICGFKPCKPHNSGFNFYMQYSNNRIARLIMQQLLAEISPGTTVV